MRESTTTAGIASRRTYTAHDVARILGMSTRWVLYQAAQGTLPCIRIGRRVLFSRDRIDALIPMGVPPAAASASVGLQADC